MTNFSIEKNVDGQFYATFKSDNGEMVWKTSEFYVAKQKAIKAIGILYEHTMKLGWVRIIDNTLKKPTERLYRTPKMDKK